MGFLLLSGVGLAFGLAGLVQLWRHAGSRFLVIGIGILAATGLACFTSETWYSWFDFYRGDGQVFIGMFLIGLAMWAAALGLGILAGIVAAIRPKPRNSASDANAASQTAE